MSKDRRIGVRRVNKDDANSQDSLPSRPGDSPERGERISFRGDILIVYGFAASRRKTNPPPLPPKEKWTVHYRCQGTAVLLLLLLLFFNFNKLYYTTTRGVFHARGAAY